MIAVDTNVIVRWIVRDDEDQAAIADTVMQEPVLLSLTVLVEVAWVLGSRRYGMSRSTLAAILSDVVDTRTVHVEREADVRWCVNRFAAGADLADMVHLIAVRGATRFTTFDGRLADQAGPTTPIAIETLA